MNWKEYFDDYVFYGAIDLTDTIDLSFEIGSKPFWVEPMRYWWSFSIKYFCPYILWHIFMYGLISDLQGKSYLNWEILKWVYVVICPIIVIVFFILELKPETFEKEFDKDEDMDLTGKSSV